MSLFGRKGERPPQEPLGERAASPVLGVRDRGLDSDDPRSALVELLRSSGLSVVLMGPGPVEAQLGLVGQRAPTFRRSTHFGKGWMSFVDDPDTLWVAVENSDHSAIIVITMPSSDAEFLVNSVIQPFDDSSQLTLELIHLGEGSSQVVELVDTAEVAPAWEFDGFEHIEDHGKFPVLPISLRRMIWDWKRLGSDLYLLDVETASGRKGPVALGVLDDSPSLYTVIDGIPEKVAREQLADLNVGSYSVARVDDLVLLAREVPPGAAADELESSIHELLRTRDALLAMGTRVRGSDQSANGASTLWDRLASCSETRESARALASSIDDEYTTTERVRDVPTPGGDAFESVERRALSLRARRGSGFELSWRGERDQPLTPSWFSARSARVDRASGNVVLAGHPTHEMWGLSPAYDLGAIDGSNQFAFPEAGHTSGTPWPNVSLYVGSLRSGRLVPLDVTTDVISVDLDPGTGRIAALCHAGGTDGFIAIYDSNAERRILTAAVGLLGSEVVRFSPDGRWLLLSGSSGTSTLVDSATGEWLSLDVDNACWWPARSSTLLTVRHDADLPTPWLFDLAENAYIRSFPGITLDMPYVPNFPHIWQPEVSPDGERMLGRSSAGVSAEFQTQHGAGSHLVEVLLSEGRGSLVRDVFLEADDMLERDVSEARWAGDLPDTIVKLHPDLQSALNSPRALADKGSDTDSSTESVWLLPKIVNRAIELTDSRGDTASLWPEALAALATISPETNGWAEVSGWLHNLCARTSQLIADGSMTGAYATFWGDLAGALAAVDQGRRNELDPTSALRS